MHKLIYLFFLAILLPTGSLLAEEMEKSESDLILAALSKDAAAEIIREKQNGRILEIKSKDENGKTVHVIKILTHDDRIKKYRIDAETGKVLDNK